ncbi:hypothetical protein [Massilia horti]|uniref:Uncharacterized protein n=1 Tax=Massilia horti TaxID=2562153 RepID=A0A4Y9SW76_9BURK|nr:hypothetical protein [Massilia horti]TFW29609.1 hypothetical protein E4O92_18895 [Massilia horti]
MKVLTYRLLKNSSAYHKDLAVLREVLTELQEYYNHTSLQLRVRPFYTDVEVHGSEQMLAHFKLCCCPLIPY